MPAGVTTLPPDQQPSEPRHGGHPARTPRPEDGLAQALFVAYNDQGPNPWRTFDGRPVPRWDDLTDQVVEKWRAVARRAVELL